MAFEHIKLNWQDEIQPAKKAATQRAIPADAGLAGQSGASFRIRSRIIVVRQCHAADSNPDPTLAEFADATTTSQSPCGSAGSSKARFQMVT